MKSDPGQSLELSVVMPCLNEADTLGDCITRARDALVEGDIRGEIIVADNGSMDESKKIAIREGAILVEVPQHPIPSRNGYGRGLMHGIASAKAPFVIMGDSDDSYDFGEIGRFYRALRDGADLVQGCRLPGGGGKILPGAMPWSHRWIGNPLFSFLVRRWFNAPVTDVNCGLRAFRKNWFDKADLRCPGMEFAAEMILKAGVFGARIAEVPITLRPDGRVHKRPHLKTFRDGWRILRLLMLFSPAWLYLIPGAGLLLLGMLGYFFALPGNRIQSVLPDVNTLLFASAFILCGYQAILFGFLSKTFAVTEGLLPARPWYKKVFSLFNLERGLLVGGIALVAGLGLGIHALMMWYRADFGDLSYPVSLRWSIPSATLIVLGFQTILASFFTSILGMGRGPI